MYLVNITNPTQVDQAVHDALEQHEYLLPDGSKDTAKIRENMFEVLRGAKVQNLKDRADKAVTRGAMVERIFPDLPGPDQFASQENPQLALEVWTKVDVMLWGMASVNAGASLQRLVSVNMGNGYVLCRTKISKDRTSAVYITDDVRCIERDFVGPDNESLARKAQAVVANREMLILRQPTNADRYARSYSATLKSILDAGTQRLALTVASVANGDQPDDDDEDGSES